MALMLPILEFKKMTPTDKSQARPDFYRFVGKLALDFARPDACPGAPAFAGSGASILRTARNSIFLLFLLTILTACGGNKLLKEPEPLVLNQPLARAQDDKATIYLDWVIVRYGPGSWAKNANWDEYLLRVQNDSLDTLEVTSVRAWDSQDVAQAPLNDRKQLVRQSKETAKRYKKEGVEVKAGASAGALWIASGAAIYGGSALGLGALYSGSAAAAGTAGSGA